MSRRIAFLLAFLALVLAFVVVENLPHDAAAASVVSKSADVAANLGDLPLMYE